MLFSKTVFSLSSTIYLTTYLHFRIQALKSEIKSAGAYTEMFLAWELLPRILKEHAISLI